ncbi:MAG TPA: NADH-quinone oxidoreductase subunit H [Treponemataceae bacterium]|nr:NADH-quinone oxidoreductase subunit H [Treponemataceae bacterium]HPS43875.1 NADH-quinone oxidoreductase subunit H [Treponemataceae bacterium]
MIATPLHLLLLLVLPPLLLGVINKTKAFFAGRVGAPFLQPYYDIAKLLRKGMVVSSTTTWVFIAGPVVSVAVAVVAGLMIPLGNVGPVLSFTGDFLLFAYLFALARFFTVSAALDTGSPFEGMGSAREVTFAVLTEPALFFAFLALARLSGSLSLGGMFAIGSTPAFSVGNAAPLVLVVVGLFIVLLAENCRLPVDDPTTHLELTMIHEAMVLDHSGPLLGLIEYGSSVKLFVLESLVLNLVLPLSALPVWLGAAAWAVGLIAVSAVVGVIESSMARLRMSRVPTLLIAAILLCGSAFVMLVR